MSIVFSLLKGIAIQFSILLSFQILIALYILVSIFRDSIELLQDIKFKKAYIYFFRLWQYIFFSLWIGALIGYIFYWIYRFIRWWLF